MANFSHLLKAEIYTQQQQKYGLLLKFIHWRENEKEKKNLNRHGEEYIIKTSCLVLVACHQFAESTRNVSFLFDVSRYITHTHRHTHTIHWCPNSISISNVIFAGETWAMSNNVIIKHWGRFLNPLKCHVHTLFRWPLAMFSFGLFKFDYESHIIYYYFFFSFVHRKRRDDKKTTTTTTSRSRGQKRERYSERKRAWDRMKER